MGSSESHGKDDSDSEKEDSWFDKFTGFCYEAGKAAGIGVATEAGSKAFDYAWDKINEDD